MTGFIRKHGKTKENMSIMKTKTLHEIHTDGRDALLKDLGPVDTIRFLQMFDDEKAIIQKSA